MKVKVIEVAKEWTRKLENWLRSRLKAAYSVIKRNKILAGPIFLTALTASLLFLGMLSIDIKAADEVLSSVFQVSVAILAVAFSIVLVIGQLASSYSPRMLSQVFKPLTIGYMFSFIINAVLSLLVLASEEPFLGLTKKTWIQISLTVTVACLSFLVPYFYYVKDWLRPKRLIHDLKEDVEKILEKSEIDNVRWRVNTIRDIITGSYQRKAYDIFENGIEALRDIAILVGQFFISKKVDKKKQQFADNTVKMLGDIGCSVAGDPTAGVKVAYDIAGIGDKWVSKDITRTKKILEILYDIGKTSLEKKCDKTALQVGRGIYWIGARSMHSNLSSLRRMPISHLRSFYSAAVEAKMFNVANEASYHLKFLGNLAIKRAFDNETRNVLSAESMILLKSMELKREKETPNVYDSLFSHGMKASESQLTKSTESAIYFLYRAACKAVGIREDWAKAIIFRLQIVVSKSSESVELLEIAKEGATFLHKIYEECPSNHQSLALYIAMQLWILSGESSEKFASHVLYELIELKNKIGEEQIKEGYREAQKWAQTKNEHEIYKKLESRKKLFKYFEATSSDRDEWVHS